MKILWIVAALCAMILAKSKSMKPSGSDIREGKTYTMCETLTGRMYYYKETANTNDYCDKGIAKAVYKNDINETGWAFVEVEVSDYFDIPKWKQGYAAGFVEGRATRELIQLHIQNTVDGYCDAAEKYCEELNEYLLRNLKWMMKEIEHHPNDDYWVQVNITLNQLFGMVDGFDGHLNQRLSLQELAAHPVYMIQLAGDLEDLSAKFHKPENPRRMKTGKGRCSALVKLLPDHSDIFFSHVTWASYSSLLRMQKKYSFKTGDPGHTYSFSSYPGSIASVDDFIVTSARLSIFETTIGNYNEQLYPYMTHKSVLTWIRSQIAHRTASSGLQWAEAFAKHNSGTYNNQWVVVDYKKFKRGRKEMQGHGLIHVLEQMPRHIVHADMTSFLVNSTYWPSYNCPYFPQIFKWSDAPKMVEKYGEWYSYEQTPRALIFARDHSAVSDMDSMTRLMRSNNFTRDPLSACDCSPPYSGENAISCRSDLNPAKGKYPFEALGFRDHGATDMKITNSRLIDSLSFTSISGPTHDPTPVFDWDTATFRDTVPHHGQPKRWTFPSITHQWTKGSLFEREPQGGDFAL